MDKKLTIIDFTSEGLGVARSTDKRVYMIKGAVPGDVVTIDEKTAVTVKNIIFSKVGEIVTSSPDRQDHPCEHYNSGCPGCRLGVYDYSKSLEWKQKNLSETISRIGHLGELQVLEPMPSPEIWGYRDRIELQFNSSKGEPVIGFSSDGEIIPIRKCLLASEPIQAVQKALFDLLAENKNFVSETFESRLLIRDNGDNSAIIVLFFEIAVTKKTIETLSELFIKAGAVGCQILRGRDFKERFNRFSSLHKSGDCKISIPFMDDLIPASPVVFTQTNRNMSATLIETVMQHIKPEQTLLDLFGGFGAFGLAHAKRGGVSIVAEESEKAVVAGSMYAARDQLGIKYFAQNLFNPHFRLASIKRGVEVIVVDPPRSGLNKTLKKGLNSSGITDIVYVSCHPAALARDLKDLNTYRVISLQPIDMFPNTPDLETVAVLKRKK